MEVRGDMTGETGGRLQKYFAIALQKIARKRDHAQDHEQEQAKERRRDSVGGPGKSR
jgi:hypothetical protein